MRASISSAVSAASANSRSASIRAEGGVLSSASDLTAVGHRVCHGGAKFDAPAIVDVVVSLGRGVGLQVTAEGVETPDQQLFLRAAGVHNMQGFRFGKAVTTAEISARPQAPESSRIDEPPNALAG